MYFFKTPLWLKKLFKNYTWHIPVKSKVLYLTFDDGPHPTATPFVLQQLKKYQAKATFFCIGKNVVAQQNLYNTIIADGHVVGNHTHNHLNGWKANTDIYIDNVLQASSHIYSRLFRPPYGRITRKQGKKLRQHYNFNIIMWDVLSGDFDINLSPEKCMNAVIQKAVPGSIIVFHDSEKAYKNMSYALPRVLEHFTKKGYVFAALPVKNNEGLR